MKLAEGLSLPTEAATETFLIVGKRGSGKSSTATRLAERLMTAKVPIAVLDPVDVWWGLKAGADGNPGGGFPVYVFGGEHADLPLEPTSGRLMAQTIVQYRINAVFVLRQFSNKEKARFVADFADELFKLNRDVMHLFCEEAHEVMPQNPYAGEEEMLGRMLRLEKLGRTSGVGMTAITQRPASLNKNATTQAEVVIAHRLMGPQDRDAIFEWVKYHHLQKEGTEFIESLPTLKTGEAWIWAPDFPEDKPVGLRRIQVLMPETFDSRRTPKPGERRRTATLVSLDLGNLGERMKSIAERAKANDPDALKARIRELEKQPTAGRSIEVHYPKPTRIEVPVLKDAQIARLEGAISRAEKYGERFGAALALFMENVNGIKVALNGAPTAALSSPGRPSGHGAADAKGRHAALGGPVRAAAPAANLPTGHRPSAGDRRVDGRSGVERAARSGESRAPSDSDLYHGRYLGKLGKGERKVLAAIAQHDGGVTREQLTVLTGYKRSSRDTYLQRLTSAGLAEQADGAGIVATQDGIDVLGHDYEQLPTGDALREYWQGRLTGGERAVFEVVTSAYPKAIERETISEHTEYKRSSRDTYLQRLASRKLVVTVGRGAVRASAALFG